ncbi:uroporphyrinogen decarboxylase family protein [Oceanirhabdus sp. W0125-5]|uniref:uroporphyrinogen decarboxylase family protein n=1 Tax=Oceanirhabdus sp. W0125-5 TaxID=2999116 RepID=UPI0022F2AAB8|nr:uroporphyrinogen decarboxylase family protein [Oceanirhabdus sp. W0125-5]WBW95907.1 uroporphyrinogen decarboxylase family protein [Oceanirhabdus sp. W0125-5]
MENNINFKCTSDKLEEIPQSIIENTGLMFPKAHINMEEMSRLALELKKYNNDTICRVPFSTTVEAEAMGAKIKLGDEKNGPRVSEYAFSTIEELACVEEIDLSNGRIKEVLNSVEYLSDKNEVVALNVEGTFTIISSLIEPRLFYKAIRKNRDIVDKFIKVIEDSIVKYAVEGIKRGAKIISYGDPVGAMDIVGPKIYKEISGRSTYNILKRLEGDLESGIIHLCGKTSTAFQEIGLSKAEAIEYSSELTYGEAINDLIENNESVKIVGHRCIKKTPLKLKNPIVWKIILN